MDDDVRQEFMIFRAAMGEQNNRIVALEAKQAATSVKIGAWGVFGAILGALGIILLRML